MENHHFCMVKSTISMAMFNSFLDVYQSVTPNKIETTGVDFPIVLGIAVV